MAFRECDPNQLHENPFHLIGKEWMLVTAGDVQNHNTMTASWGGLGVLWNKPIATIYIRPQRFTYQFLEQNDMFTLSFFTEQYRNTLSLCGSKSGRDIDKDQAAALTPLPCAECGATFYQQARLVLVCKKIYAQDLDPARFLDDTIHANYKGDDYHRMYIGQITKIFVQE